MTYAARITKWGNSQAIRLPKELLVKLDLKEADHISLNLEGDKIIIKKVAPDRPEYKSLEELFYNYNGSYDCEIINWGEPVGKEILD